MTNTQSSLESDLTQAMQDRRAAHIRYCAMLVRPSEAEDIVQQAYSRAWEKRHTFAGKAKISTWLTTIVHRSAMGFFRHASSRPILEPIYSLESHDPRLIDNIDIERQAINSERVSLLATAINEVPPKLRRGLHVWLNEAPGYQSGTNKCRAHRAREILKRKLRHAA